MGVFHLRLKDANKKLKELANHDGLTGLYNRHGLMEAVAMQLNEDSQVALLKIKAEGRGNCCIYEEYFES